MARRSSSHVPIPTRCAGEVALVAIEIPDAFGDRCRERIGRKRYHTAVGKNQAHSRAGRGAHGERQRFVQRKPDIARRAQRCGVEPRAALSNPAGARKRQRCDRGIASQASDDAKHETRIARDRDPPDPGTVRRDANGLTGDRKRGTAVTNGAEEERRIAGVQRGASGGIGDVNAKRAADLGHWRKRVARALRMRRDEGRRRGGQQANRKVREGSHLEVIRVAASRRVPIFPAPWRVP